MIIIITITIIVNYYKPIAIATAHLGLHTILPLQILYGVWHTNGGSGEGVVYCATVLQKYCNGVGFAVGGGNKRRIDSHKEALK